MFFSFLGFLGFVYSVFPVFLGFVSSLFLKGDSLVVAFSASYLNGFSSRMWFSHTLRHLLRLKGFPSKALSNVWDIKDVHSITKTSSKKSLRKKRACCPLRECVLAVLLVVLKSLGNSLVFPDL